MGNLTQSDMTIVLILITVIIVLLAIIAVLDIISRKKKKEPQFAISKDDEEKLIIEEKNEEIEELPIELPTTSSEPIKAFVDKPNHVQEIKYVEEDEELEKTKARIELAELKEELKRQEEFKKLEENKKEEIKVQEKKDNAGEITSMPISSEANEVNVNLIEENKELIQEDLKEQIKEQIMEEIELLDLEEIEVPSEEFTKQEVAEIANAINEQLAKVEEESNLQRVNEVQEDLNEILEISKEDIIAAHEDEQERKAIISVEEFNKISDEMYDNNEVIQMAYEDEGNEPISLMELENLYNTREMKTIKLDDFETIKPEEKEAIIKDADIKKMEDLPPIAIEKKFKSSPFISPVYGISETKETIELEQTANLDKLNEEIKKTNEFLKTLKELQKNLD